MSLPSGKEPAKRGRIATRAEETLNAVTKWGEKAFAAESGGAIDLRPPQRLFVIGTLTLVLLLVGAICCFVSVIVISLTSFEPIPGVPSGVRLGVYLWPLVMAFLAYLLIQHGIAFAIASCGKAALHAMEYTYLLIATLGLASVVSVGVDENISGKQFYLDQVAGLRSRFDSSIDDIRTKLCSDDGPKLNAVPRTAICEWFDRAKLLADRPLNGDSDEDNKQVRNLIDEGNKLVAIAARNERSMDLTDNQRAGLFDFKYFVYDADTDLWGYKYFLKRGSFIAKIDAELKKNEESSFASPSVWKLLGTLALAFALAVRISKVSVEASGVVRK